MTQTDQATALLVRSVMPAGAASPEELEGMLEDTHRSMQSGPLALIISEAAISVARRNLEGLHYVISRLDL